MKRTILAASIISAVALSAAPASAEPMKITIGHAMQVFAGLSKLDGADHVVKDGANEKVVKEAYKLGSGMRFAVARDISHLRDVVQAEQTAFREVLGKYNDADLKKADSDASKQANAEIQKLNDTEITVDLTRFKLSEFQLDQNTALPPSVLADLDPIIDEK